MKLWLKKYGAPLIALLVIIVVVAWVTARMFSTPDREPASPDTVLAHEVEAEFTVKPKVEVEVVP